jgi:hypothetical protein
LRLHKTRLHASFQAALAAGQVLYAIPTTHDDYGLLGAATAKAGGGYAEVRQPNGEATLYIALPPDAVGASKRMLAAKGVIQTDLQVLKDHMASAVDRVPDLGRRERPVNYGGTWRAKPEERVGNPDWHDFGQIILTPAEFHELIRRHGGSVLCDDKTPANSVVRKLVYSVPTMVVHDFIRDVDRASGIKAQEKWGGTPSVNSAGTGPGKRGLERFDDGFDATTWSAG